MTDPLGNYVRIGEGETRRLHLVDHALDVREIRDPATGLVRPVRVLVFSVDEVDGVALTTSWSVTSAALASELAPYLADRSYRSYTWWVSRRGSGFGTLYSVARIPRPPA